MTLKYKSYVWAAAFGIAGAMQPSWAQQCVNFDPFYVTAQVYGDYELTLDTDDPTQHLIFISQVADGPSSVVIARVDGRTGQVDAGSLTTIADNFRGFSRINGPEFVHPPGHGLGALYRALDGVHGVFRPVGARAWNDFSLDVTGAPANKSPPALPSTYPGSYEGGGLPLDQYTFTLVEGQCGGKCFASMRWGVPTDATAVLAQQNLTVPSISALSESPRDGTIYFEACRGQSPGVFGRCGLYEATIDNSGGFIDGTLHLLATVGAPVKQVLKSVPLAAARHPVTGVTVLFLGGSHAYGQTVDVYEQKRPGAEMTLVASVPVSSSDHYRIIDSGTELVLHYLIRNGSEMGSYTIPVRALGQRLQVGASKKIAPEANGAEVEYLPAAGKFAIFFRTSLQPSLIQRCWFVP